MSIICPSCGTPAPPGAVFCDNCGYDIRAVSQDSQQPMPPTFHVPESEVQGGSSCPACGHVNVVGSVFCENCGSQLTQEAPISPPPVQPPVQQPPQHTPQSPPESPPPVKPASPIAAKDTLSGNLLVLPSNQSISIPVGKEKILIGREDPVSGVFPDIDLESHGGHESGVGRQHAQLVIIDGQYHLEDLDSINGTFVNKKRVLPNQPHPLKDGDLIRLGKIELAFHTS